MTRRAWILIVLLGALITFGLYRVFHEVDPQLAWTRQAIGTWIITDREDESNFAELTLDADGQAHLYLPLNNQEQTEIDAYGSWRIAFANEEIAILEFSYSSGLEDWIEENRNRLVDEEQKLTLDKVFYYLERTDEGFVRPVMGGAESFGIGWIPFRDSSWEPTSDWNEALVGYWNYGYWESDGLSALDPVQMKMPEDRTAVTWNTEVRSDGTWNWRLDTDIGTWQVLYDLGEYAIVEFVETGDKARRILTFQKLHPNGTISTIMYSGYHSDETMADYHTFERKE